MNIREQRAETTKRKDELTDELMAIRKNGIPYDLDGIDELSKNTEHLFTHIGCRNASGFEDDLTWAIYTLLNDEDAHILLSIYGLSEDCRREKIPDIMSRREAYCKAMGAKPDTMIRKETQIIGTLAKKLVNNFDENHLSMPINNLPYNKNEYFTGRIKLLRDIYRRFQSGEYISRIQRISQIDGMGKTQAALEYAYRFRHKYSMIGWIRAETDLSIVISLQEILDKLGLNPKSIEKTDILQTFHSWAEENDDWLLIFDDVEDFQSLNCYLPKQIRGNILITSGLNGDLKGVLAKIDVFDENEALRFFDKRIGHVKDDENANKLAYRLGYFPLALEQAAAYIAATPGVGFAEYLSKINHFGVKVLDRKTRTANYKRTVKETFLITLDKIRSDYKDSIKKSAEQLINICAFLAPDNISLYFLIEYNKFYPKPLCCSIMNELERDEILQLLSKYSLVTFPIAEEQGLMSRAMYLYAAARYDVRQLRPEIMNNGGMYIRMHRLLQEVIREELSLNKKEWVSCSFNAYYDLSKYLKDIDEMAECTTDYSQELVRFTKIYHFEKCAPHALIIADHMKIISNNTPTLKIAQMYYKYGLLLVSFSSNYKQGLLYMQKALSIREQKLGKKHIDTAIAYFNVGKMYFYLKNDIALKYYIEAFNILYALLENKPLGKRHLVIARVCNFIGIYHNEKGDKDRAICFLETALNLYNDILSKHCPMSTAIMLNLEFLRSGHTSFKDWLREKSK
jgi:hypothetical protein